MGELTNAPDLEGEGIGEKITGKVQKKIGQVEKGLGEKIPFQVAIKMPAIEDGCDESK